MYTVLRIGICYVTHNESLMPLALPSRPILYSGRSLCTVCFINQHNESRRPDSHVREKESREVLTCNTSTALDRIYKPTMLNFID